MKEFYPLWHEATIAQLISRGSMEVGSDEIGDYFKLTEHGLAESKRVLEDVYRSGFKIKGDEHEWILRRSKRNAKERRFFRCDSHARPASKWFDYPTTPLEEARKIPNTVKFEDDSNMAIPQFGKECKIRGVGLDYKVRIMIARPYGPREDITDIVFHAPSGMWYNANICRAMDRNLLWGSQGPDGVPLVGVDEGNKDDDDEDEDDDKTKEITTCDEEAQEKGGQDAPFMEWELRM